MWISVDTPETISAMKIDSGSTRIESWASSPVEPAYVHSDEVSSRWPSELPSSEMSAPTDATKDSPIISEASQPAAVPDSLR